MLLKTVKKDIVHEVSPESAPRQAHFRFRLASVQVSFGCPIRSFTRPSLCDIRRCRSVPDSKTASGILVVHTAAKGYWLFAEMTKKSGKSLNG